MSPFLGVVVMMNNYFHDVATALLLASAVTMWVIFKRLGNSADKAVIGYVLSLYKGITRMAKFALAWILIGGIPRTIFYKEFEWSNAAGKGQSPALIAKHILAFVFVGAGFYLWVRTARRIRKLKENAQLAA